MYTAFVPKPMPSGMLPPVGSDDPWKLSQNQLLEMIDSVEAFQVIRRRCMKISNISDPDSDRKVRLLIQGTIERYMAIMAPKLHGYVETIIGKQVVSHTSDQVKTVYGTRLGTTAPADIFNIMIENLRSPRPRCSAACCPP
jgi:hypothetical protein